MRNITAIVDVNGKIDVTTQLIGYSGEHNAVLLEVGFTNSGLSLYSAADYFRIVIDGFYSDKLFLNHENVVQYNLPQEVMKPPKVNCQLLGYKGDGTELSLILKSSVFSFQVDCSEVPFQKLDKGPDYFEEALHLCTASVERARDFCEVAGDFCDNAQKSAKSALNSADLSKSNLKESGIMANNATLAAQRAERAAESLNFDNLSNALKGSVSGEFVNIGDISQVEHYIKIRLLNQDDFNKTVKLIKYDENLLSGNIVKKPIDWFSSSDGIILPGYDEVYLSSKNYYQPLILEGSYLLSGKEYMVSVDVINFELNNNEKIDSNNKPYNSYDVALSYTDSNGRKYESSKLKLDTLGRLQLGFTPTVSGIYNFICFGRDNTSGSVTFTNPQVMLKESVEEYIFDDFGMVQDFKNNVSCFCLTTDTARAKIECEYNRDINKAFAELQQAIISLGGNI